MLTFYYHLHADGTWYFPVTEFFGTLRDTRYPGRVQLGVVGTPAAREYALTVVRTMWPASRLIITAEQDTGYEQVTLNALRENLTRVHEASEHIIYAHTKGAFNVCASNDAWRQAMNEKLVRDWAWRDTDLRDYDAVGMHWIDTGQEPPFFAGNFWAATVAYLRTLGPVLDETRFAAERWIGMAPVKPNIRDLAPGWPDY